jgi:hypothetical protein
MAVHTWQVVAKVDCGRAKPAELLEERVYPAGLLDDASGLFHVRAQRCAQAEECRDAGLACRWTGLNPNYDPFEA